MKLQTGNNQKIESVQQKTICANFFCDQFVATPNAVLCVGCSSTFDNFDTYLPADFDNLEFDLHLEAASLAQDFAITCTKVY